jgi:peptide/nickel transport system permease protein
MRVAVRRVVARPDGAVGLLIVGAYLLIALLAPVVVPYDPLHQFRGAEMRSLSLAHPLGTDELGRDILSRVLYGTRLSLTIALVSVALAAVIGVPVGLLAGYVEGVPDALMMRPLEGLLAFPSILTGIAMATILGTGSGTVAVAVAVINVPTFARIARAAMLAEKAKEYILAARSIGASPRRIIGRHVLPNTLTALITQAVLATAFSVLLEAALSFLGLGVQRPSPSWGVMLDDGRAILRDAPWAALAPGAALLGLLAGLTLLSDAVLDALSPRQSQRL